MDVTQHIDSLPADLLIRSARRDDAQAISAINVLYEVAETGSGDSTAAQVCEVWDDEQLDLATNSRVVTTASGQLIGYTGVAGTSRGVFLDVHTTVHPDYKQLPILSYLLRFANERAPYVADAYPHYPRRLYTYSFSAERSAHLVQDGYTIEVSDYQMERHLDTTPPVAPQPLPGVTIRPFIQGQEEHAVYAVIAESFPDIDGKPYRAYEDWYESIFLRRSSFDPSMLYVAVADEQIVGVVCCRTYPEEQGGYVWQFGMRRAWRRRGIARQLLLTVFNEFYRRGLYHIQLEVDSQNKTGAQELYASLGLHKRTQVDFVTKAL